MITTLDSITTGMLNAPTAFMKTSVTAEGAGTFHSLWKQSGLPGAGSNPRAPLSMLTRFKGREPVPVSAALATRLRVIVPPTDSAEATITDLLVQT